MRFSRRRPEVTIVDELPHTNVPGSRHEKRYQDVLDILAAGINVIGALNIQHLESLKDIVERTTGVQIRETVPDTFLKQADQIVNLDLAIEDLTDRLSCRQDLRPGEDHRGAGQFFQHQNLATLRELALREVAESVDRSVQSRTPDSPPSAPGPTAGSWSAWPRARRARPHCCGAARGWPGG